MVLNSDDTSPGGLGTTQQQILVNGLESERVHHTDVDSLTLQSVVGSDSLLEGHSGTDNSHFVIV